LVMYCASHRIVIPGGRVNPLRQLLVYATIYKL
jgi:hypothetical protein